MNEAGPSHPAPASSPSSSGSAQPPQAKAAKTTDRPTLATVAVTKERLALRLGQRILNLATRKRRGLKLAVQPLAECANEIIALDTGGPYTLKPAWREQAGSPSSNDRVSIEAIDPPQAYLGRFLGARVSGGVVTTAEGQTVAESLVGLPRHGLFSRDPDGSYYQGKQRLSRQRRIRDMTTVLLSGATNGDYGRWLTEDLPRLAFVEDHFDLRRLSFIIATESEPMRAIYEDALALFGIRADQIVEAGADTLLVDDLVYPAPLVQFPFALAPRCVAVLEQLATRVRANPFGHQRLYVSAAQGDKTRLTNEAALVSMAERRGFAVIEPDALSFYQQIGLFRQARIIVGPAYAGLANAVFSTQDLTLVALNPSSLDNDFFSHLMSLKDGRYVDLGGTANPSEETFTIDVARFDQVLDQIAGPGSRP